MSNTKAMKKHDPEYDKTLGFQTMVTIFSKRTERMKEDILLLLSKSVCVDSKNFGLSSTSLGYPALPGMI